MKQKDRDGEVAMLDPFGARHFATLFSTCFSSDLLSSLTPHVYNLCLHEAYTVHAYKID